MRLNIDDEMLDTRLVPEGDSISPTVNTINSVRAAEVSVMNPHSSVHKRFNRVDQPVLDASPADEHSMPDVIRYEEQKSRMVNLDEIEVGMPEESPATAPLKKSYLKRQDTDDSLSRDANPNVRAFVTSINEENKLVTGSSPVKLPSNYKSHNRNASRGPVRIDPVGGEHPQLEEALYGILRRLNSLHEELNTRVAK